MAGFAEAGGGEAARDRDARRRSTSDGTWRASSGHEPSSLVASGWGPDSVGKKNGTRSWPQPLDGLDDGFHAGDELRRGVALVHRGHALVEEHADPVEFARRVDELAQVDASLSGPNDGGESVVAFLRCPALPIVVVGVGQVKPQLAGLLLLCDARLLSCLVPGGGQAESTLVRERSVPRHP